MGTGTIQKEQEQPILTRVAELEELLELLIQKIDNLVQRNPAPNIKKGGEERPDNVFDEIIQGLARCRGNVEEATVKVILGVAKKVQ